MVKRPQLLGDVDAVLAAVASPDYREADPIAGHERFYQQRVTDKVGWPRVVVGFNRTPAVVVTPAPLSTKLTVLFCQRSTEGIYKRRTRLDHNPGSAVRRLTRCRVAVSSDLPRQSLEFDEMFAMVAHPAVIR